MTTNPSSRPPVHGWTAPGGERVDDVAADACDLDESTTAEWQPVAAHVAGDRYLSADSADASTGSIVVGLRVSWWPVAAFVLISFGLAWLVCLPLWLGDGLASPLLGVCAVAMMATPAIGALLVSRFVDRPVSIPRALGLWPLRPVGRLLGYLGLGLVVPVVIVLAALPIGAALGFYPADVTGFSAFRELTEQQVAQATAGLGDPGPLPPIGLLVALQLVSIPIGAFVNTVPALGEELGWRGFLLPRLLPLGTAPAVLVSGVAWGLWHTPLILLGYNYGGETPGWLGVLMMTGTCVVVGAVFAWLRLRSASVWPAALAHGAFNAAAGSYLLFAAAGERIDLVQGTILGWSGWIVPVLLVAVLAATGQFRRPGATRRR
ncbi:CPBP family intramembrane glutamic endopeptidase [Frigoribacterium sp. VKM Ac-2530]|uniref:CPBP family intramembrane glutamic endopeptidase n=1 Tax=Frigoribacterium sp. VKM Ac-2530 TaxID=2783822 RepID=UPI00188CAEBD|nr:CPBP family intramembrane glutamic endopeptidase [Frigoribacterium sp. VKM Ac-2530]MBF4580111.1 CPBP family intramembrane metalloprotease [Frigoribacterium sp. VKM Ac-2530]